MAEKTRIRALWVAEEVTFGVDPDPDGSDYKYTVAECDLPDISYDMIESQTQSPRLAHDPPEAGPQKAKLNVKVPIRASGTPRDGGAGPFVTPECHVFLKNIMGTATAGVGSTSAGTPTTTTIDVTDAAGFVKGGIAYFEGPNEFRVIKSIATNTLTVAPALTSAPNGTTDKVISANYYRPGDTGQKTVACVVQFGTKKVLLLGGRIDSAKIAGINPKQRPTLEMSIEFDSWALAPVKASLPAATDTYPTVRAPIVKGSPFFYNEAKYLVSGLEFDFGVKSIFLETTEGAQTRSGAEVVDRQPKGSFEPYFQEQVFTDMANETTVPIAFACGLVPGKGVGFSAPKAQITAAAVQDKNGVIAQKVDFGCFYAGAADDEFIVSVF